MGKKTYVVTAPETGERLRVTVEEIEPLTTSPFDGQPFEPPQHPSRVTLFEAFDDDLNDLNMGEWLVTSE